MTWVAMMLVVLAATWVATRSLRRRGRMTPTQQAALVGLAAAAALVAAVLAWANRPTP